MTPLGASAVLASVLVGGGVMAWLVHRGVVPYHVGVPAVMVCLAVALAVAWEVVG